MTVSVRVWVAALVCGLMATAVNAKPRTIDNADLKYTVTVPGECRIEEGPGTLEAICDPGMDEAKSAEASTATALLLEVDAELAPADAKPYGLADFKQEVPEAVCGESDAGKVKLGDAASVSEGAATVFTATVTCAEIRFLGLPERQGRVRYVIQPGHRYRIMARALAPDAAKAKPVIEAFFASFKSTAGAK